MSFSPQVDHIGHSSDVYQFVKDNTVRTSAEEGFQLKPPGMKPSITINHPVKVYWCIIVDVEKGKVGQAVFPHRCPHVVVEPSQCASTSLTFTRRHRDCTGHLQKNTDVRKYNGVTILDCLSWGGGPQI